MLDQYTGINRFFLYGEAARPAEDDFIHLEKLDDRSRPANWQIRPHAHADLHHLFIIESGGGVADADALALDIAGPGVVAVPAGTVHGFRWQEDTVGLVLTFADPLLRAVSRREPLIGQAYADGLWSATGNVDRLLRILAHMELELSWVAPGHALALESQLTLCLIEAMRLHHDRARTAGAPVNAQGLLVARYREYLETHFREHPTVTRSARDLGASSGRLRAACRHLAGATPVQLLHERLALEAQRLMRYSNMSVAQTAHYLGFDDPAYFSRFFSRTAGKAPRTFKNERMHERTAVPELS